MRIVCHVCHVVRVSVKGPRVGAASAMSIVLEARGRRGCGGRRLCYDIELMQVGGVAGGSGEDDANITL